MPALASFLPAANAQHARFCVLQHASICRAMRACARKQACTPTNSAQAGLSNFLFWLLLLCLPAWPGAVFSLARVCFCCLLLHVLAAWVLLAGAKLRCCASFVFRALLPLWSLHARACFVVGGGSWISWKATERRKVLLDSSTGFDWPVAHYQLKLFGV